MSDARPTTPQFDQLAALMHAGTPAASLQQHLEGRARLLSAVDKMGKPRTRWRARSALVLACAAAATGAVLFFAHPHPPAPMAWHVENGPPGSQSYVSIPPSGQIARLVFGDGSHVALVPGSRGRVAETTPTGAKVVLEQGQAHVHVIHRDRTSWLVYAGPFDVRVTGTDFIVAWAADAETLDVWMNTGGVVVKGPVLGDAQPLSAGQHLRARIRDATVQIDEMPPPDEAKSTPAEATHTSAAPPVLPVDALGSVPPQATAGVAGSGSWPKLVEST
jgi:ferric-dicitrate binding protein FerR (iron transport regulator)